MPSALEAARVSVASLPVIDISGLTSSHAADRQEVGTQLRAACVDKGFFYIRNHGVSETLVDDVFKEAAAFFALPVEQKMAVDKARSNANRGYEPLQGQTLERGTPPDLKEGYYIGPDHKPDDPKSHRRHVQSRRQSVAGATAELSSGDAGLSECHA